MESIFNYSKERLENFLVENGYKKFMANQIFDWIYQKHEYDVNNYSNIKNENKEFIKRSFSIDMLNIKKVETDIDAKKFLFELSDKEHIEAVVMYHDYGIGVCISSQVGCNMGCKFCESGRLKKVRNLETHEMIEQIILIERFIKQRIDNVVIMGIGEPFDNYDNVIEFIRIINDPHALGIGARHITVSTCGIIPKIYEFSNLPLQVNLALSLHAPNDELRKRIMPIANAYPLNELMNAIKDYIKKTNRRLTVEYILLKGINDSIACAYELASLLKDLNAYVNLIPYNETSNIEFKASDKKTIDRNLFRDNKNFKM